MIQIKSGGASGKSGNAEDIQPECDILGQIASRILQDVMAPKSTGIEAPFTPRVIEAQFDDIDAMAASPIAWNQDYEQIGRDRFS